MLVALAGDGDVEKSDIWPRRYRDENLQKVSQSGGEPKIPDIFPGTIALNHVDFVSHCS